MKLLLAVLAIALAISLRSYRYLCLPPIDNVQLFTLISACLIQSLCSSHVIGL
jgi:hypothetical protein